MPMLFHSRTHHIERNYGIQISLTCACALDLQPLGHSYNLDFSCVI